MLYLNFDRRYDMQRLLTTARRAGRDEIAREVDERLDPAGRPRGGYPF